MDGVLCMIGVIVHYYGEMATNASVLSIELFEAHTLDKGLLSLQLILVSIGALQIKSYVLGQITGQIWLRRLLTLT